MATAATLLTPNCAIDTSRDWDDRYYYVDQVLDNPGPRTDPSFQPGEVPKASLRDSKILVIGAGGLGCEILSNLALMGFKDIHVIDMDTIDISNLNRQFLFRHDVGHPKATVAAEYIMKRVPGVKVTPFFGKIQDKDEAYYMQFKIVICGLDSIEARRWMNATLVSMAEAGESEESFKPLIDGGTEGFKGQSRVILPTVSSCYECSLDMLNKPTVFPICTIANTPRLPEHCIEWASVLEWPRVHGEKKMDTDNPEHISWLYKIASARANDFKIEGVTWTLTQGVVKNIIPAIASTNAIIAASCCNEAFKIMTSSAPYLNNYWMLIGTDGVYSYTFQHEKKPDCPVCGGQSMDVEVGKEWTLERLIEWLTETQKIQLKKPSLSTSSGKPVYWEGATPVALATRTKEHLEAKVRELVPEDEEVEVTSPTLPFKLTLKLTYV
ncbi:hypothetical protein FRB96_008546 [Tulasnella sp. 330]|nr:hypothetical protein FRB96_008546 [Tulasnella sp. 330]